MQSLRERHLSMETTNDSPQEEVTLEYQTFERFRSPKFK